jgi:hypothetical protein
MVEEPQLSRMPRACLVKPAFRALPQVDDEQMVGEETFGHV